MRPEQVVVFAAVVDVAENVGLAEPMMVIGAGIVCAALVLKVSPIVPPLTVMGHATLVVLAPILKKASFPPGLTRIVPAPLRTVAASIETVPLLITMFP